MPLRDQVPPEVELKPLPPDWTPLDGAWKPPLDELLDPSDELPDEPADPVDPAELAPEPDVEPLEEPELDELLPGPAVAAWLAPGRITATAPATATLARDTVTVVAFSRRRPCSRSATARATWRAAPWSAVSWPGERCGPAASSSQLVTSVSVAPAAVGAVGELSANVLSARHRS